jgi:hypothetical protein
MRAIRYFFPLFFALTVFTPVKAQWYYLLQKRSFTTPIEFVAAGAASGGTTSCTPGTPAGVDAGDRMFLVASSKLQTAHVSTPDGWTRIPEGDAIYSTASNGGGLGPIRQTIFYRDYDGTEGATVTVTLTGGNSINAVIYAFSKDPRARWHMASIVGSHNTGNLTAYSAPSSGKLQARKNDVYFVVTSSNNQDYNYSAQGLSQTGVTFTEVTEEIGEYPTIQGNDSEQFAGIYKVASTTTSAPGKITYVATSSGATTGKPLGVTHFIRLRQNFARQTLEPSGLRVWRASDINQTTYSGDGADIWDGMRTSFNQTGTVAEKYSIETFNGRPCFKFHAQLVNSTNWCYRAEVSQPIPWQPAWPIGTQIIHEIRVETPSDAPAVYSEWDIIQNHTGTAAGGPWPLNSPLFYVGWAYAGQTGWTAGGTATGGELMISLQPTNPNIRVKFPSIVWGANKVFRIRYHVKFDYVSGDPVFKLWAAEGDEDFELLYEDYTNPTVYVPDDIAEHGAPADVGGSPKTGIYSHGITSGAVAAASIAAGNSGYTIYMPAMKMIIQHTTDADYITDVTDNDNPIYNYVSTANE